MTTTLFHLGAGLEREAEFCNAMAAAGLSVERDTSGPDSWVGFHISNFDISKFQAAMTATGFAPQEPEAFPDDDCYCYIQSADLKTGRLILGCAFPMNESMWYFEFTAPTTA